MTPDYFQFFNDITSSDPISIFNLFLITLTLIVSYYAYRTQRLSTRVLDAKNTEQSTDFLIQNTSHTSHVVLRVKMRIWLEDDTEPRDLAEFSLDPNSSPVDYLYPSRAGTSRLPEAIHRVELGPRDFTRFRTAPPDVVLLQTGLSKAEYNEDGVTEIHFEQSTSSVGSSSEDFKTLRSTYNNTLRKDVKKQNRPLAPYVIPSDAKRIRLEIQQTGEVYDLIPKGNSWKVVSKRHHSVRIDGNEYSLNKRRTTLLNLYCLLKYDLPAIVM